MALRALVFLCAAAWCGQAQPASAGVAAPHTVSAEAPAGLETDWEMAPVLEEMSAHAGRLLAGLERVDARSWVSRGASETYVQQLDSSKQQAKALADGAKALARNPERLSAGLVVLFRIQGLEAMVGSLVDGLRRYQNADEAQRLASLSAENGANRDRFQHYLVNLATDQEQRSQVMDQEAQRCRNLLAAPVPRPAASKK